MNPIILALEVATLASLLCGGVLIGLMCIGNLDDIEMDRHRKFTDAFGDDK